MKPISFFISLSIFLGSCHTNGNDTGADKFDKTKWNIRKADDHPYRAGMYKDLIANVTLKGLKRDSVITLLGQPERTDSNYLFYTIAQERIGRFPLHTRSLVIKFAQDSTVEWRKIHE